MYFRNFFWENMLSGKTLLVKYTLKNAFSKNKLSNNIHQHPLQMICFNLVFYRTAVTFFFTILTNSPFWCPFGSIFWFFSIIELTVSSSSSMSREATRTSKRPLETLIPWVTGWREFLQRAFKLLYIRPEAPNLFRLHMGSSGQRPQRPKLYKKSPALILDTIIRKIKSWCCLFAD